MRRRGVANCSPGEQEPPQQISVLGTATRDVHFELCRSKARDPARDRRGGALQRSAIGSGVGVYSVALVCDSSSEKWI